VFLVVLGVPLLIGAIFVTGLTQAVTGQDFYLDLSRKVIERMPQIVEKSFEAASQPGAVSDPDTRAWVTAMTKVEIPFPEILKKTGIQGWLSDEVAQTVERVGKAMQGEIAPDEVVMNMRPLKAALASPEMKTYLGQVFTQLPACDQNGILRWKQRALAGRHNDPLPACNPGEEAVEKASAYINQMIGDIPDQKKMFIKPKSIETFDAVQWVDSMIWLVFLLPAIFIAIGSLLVGSGGRGFLRYCSGTVLAGGLISWLLAGLASGWLLGLVNSEHGQWISGSDVQFFGSEAGRLFASELTGTVGVVMSDLFSPVVTVALIVGAIGLGLTVLSFLIGRKRTA
ncbi:MAG: hypothetical protein JRJ87_13575, partial [Deltaproteobacteria bacterium]|nr:hypothetical protein [Deltaproteobacteria bacterium]